MFHCRSPIAGISYSSGGSCVLKEQSMPISSPPDGNNPSEGSGLCFDCPVYPIQPLPLEVQLPAAQWLPPPSQASTILSPIVMSPIDSQAKCGERNMWHSPPSSRTLCSPCIADDGDTEECCANGVDHHKRRPVPPPETTTASSSLPQHAEGHKQMRMMMREGGGKFGEEGKFAPAFSDEFPPLSQQRHHNTTSQSPMLLQSEALRGRQRGDVEGTSAARYLGLGEVAIEAAANPNIDHQSTIGAYNRSCARTQLHRTTPMMPLGWDSSSANSGNAWNAWQLAFQPVGTCCVNYAAAVVNSIGGLTEEKTTAASRVERRHVVPPLFPSLNESAASRPLLPPLTAPTPLRQLNFNNLPASNQSSVSGQFASAPPPITRPNAATGGGRAARMAVYSPPATSSRPPTSSTVPSLNGQPAATVGTAMNGPNGRQYSGNINNASSHSGIREVPVWLKSLRLHKYTPMFQAMSYAEMMALNDSQLEQRQVTKGARRKILQSLEKLQERVSLLLQLETCIDEGGDTRCLIYELRTMMNTPMCLQPTPSGLGDGDLPSHIFRVLGRLHRYLFDPIIAARGAMSGLRDVQSPEPAALEEDYVAKLLHVYEKCLQHEAFAAWQKDAILGFKRALRRFANEKGMALAGAGIRLGAGSPNANCGSSSTRTAYHAGSSNGGLGDGRGGMHANTSSSNHRHQHTLLHKARQPQLKGKLNPSTSTAQPRYNQSSYAAGRVTLAPASRFHLLRRHETSPSIVTATGQDLAALNIGSVPPSPPSTLTPSSASSTTNFPAGGPMSPPSTINEFFNPPVQRQPSACLCDYTVEQGKQRQQSHPLYPPPPGFPITPLDLFATTGGDGGVSHKSINRRQQSTVACNDGQCEKNSQIHEIMRPYYQQQEIESRAGDVLSSSRQERSSGGGKGGGAVVFTPPPTMVSQSDDRSRWVGGTELGESAKVSSYSTSIWPCTCEEPTGSAGVAGQRDQFDFAWASQASHGLAPLNVPPTPCEQSSVVRVPPRACSPADLTIYKFVEEGPLLLSNSPSKPFPPKRDTCKNTAKNDSVSDPTRFFSPLFVSYAPRTQMQWSSIFCDAEGSTSSRQDAKTHLTNSTTVNSIWGVGAVH